jgi:hypothetical protein
MRRAIAKEVWTGGARKPIGVAARRDLQAAFGAGRGRDVLRRRRAASFTVTFVTAVYIPITI